MPGLEKGLDGGTMTQRMSGLAALGAEITGTVTGTHNEKKDVGMARLWIVSQVSQASTGKKAHCEIGPEISTFDIPAPVSSPHFPI